MTAITMHQVLALETQPLKKYVINNMVEESTLFERIPYETVVALRSIVPYKTAIPTPTFRHVNEAGSELSSTYDQIERALSIIDNDVKIDPVLEMTKNNIVNPRQQQIDDASKAYAYRIVDKYINGSIVSNDREWDGLQRQLDTNALFNGQTVNASADTNELQLVPGTASDATWRGFQYKLDLTWRLVQPVLKPMKASQANFEGDSAAWITNSFAYLAIVAGLRQLKVYDQNADQYERQLPTYQGVPFIDPGFNETGAITGSFPAAGAQGTLVIGYDSEATTAANGANVYDKQTPIYLVRFGKNYNLGMQLRGLEIKDHGEEKATPHYHIVQLRWVLNPAAMWQKRAAARLVGCNFSGTVS